MPKYWRGNVWCIINDDVFRFGHELKSCLSTGYSTRYNRGFNGSHTKSFERARSLKMSNILYTVLVTVSWLKSDSETTGGAVPGYAAIYKESDCFCATEEKKCKKCKKCSLAPQTHHSFHPSDLHL